MQFNIGEAKAKLSQLIDQALRGEEVIIARDNKPLLRLVPLASVLEAPRVPGTARGEVVIAADFDDIPEDFEDYLR